MTPNDTSILYEAVLYPNRSLSPFGTMMFIIVLACTASTVALYFSSRGAWPVGVFALAEITLICLCFVIVQARGKSFERVHLTQAHLTVEDHVYSFFKRRHTTKSWTMQPYWTKVDLVELPGETNQLLLRSREQVLQIGDYMNPDERAQFAAKLSQKLAEHKKGHIS